MDSDDNDKPWPHLLAIAMTIVLVGVMILVGKWILTGQDKMREKIRDYQLNPVTEPIQQGQLGSVTLVFFPPRQAGNTDLTGEGISALVGVIIGVGWTWKRRRTKKQGQKFEAVISLEAKGQLGASPQPHIYKN